MVFFYLLKLQELNAELHALRVQKSKLENELSDVLSRHASEFEEWQQFQKDLQVAVVIANNFRAETQESMEKISEDNMKLKEQCLNQQLELDRLHMELQSLRASRSYEDARSPARSSVILSNNELRGKVSVSTAGHQQSPAVRGTFYCVHEKLFPASHLTQTQT